MYADRNKWIPKIKRECFQKPGQHILVGGTTGTGKTQCLFHIIKELKKAAPNEHILVLDIGKSSEVLRLADFADLLFFIPVGKEIEFDFVTQELEDQYLPKITYTWYNTFESVFRKLEKNRINILCIKPYHRKSDTYAKEVSKFFDTLINLALDKALKVLGKIPLTIVIDEMHWVAPGMGSALNDDHTEAGKDVQMNIDTLRSMRIRVVGATQNWTKLRKGVRDAFSWLWIRRGLSFTPTDEPRLARFNRKWETLDNDEVIVALPNRSYSDPIELPYYGEGEDIGDIYYITPTVPDDLKTDQEGLTLLRA